ncbi:MULTISPECIES: septum site-determining protein MinC [unclassified Cyanobium]|uniref:septum site-determining protein MinC n=1 Tax=unclassified Cyanobium TaxID=2627006 RepID=UPI0020CE1DEE|nr:MULTISPECIES: septum site-determining protein MinC [unclassified Cyanobium]MCP9835094.1 septum site-determining protein MinC [Cyanobium sp. La Preciosa 7G6]MCP9937857.1 septum site-determining protein MinC [Cyanobium sp. Aljojuca 7A6]
MAAALIQAIDDRQPHLLRLPAQQGSASALEEVRYALGSRRPPAGSVVLEAGSWPLRLPELRQLQELLAPLQLELVRVASGQPDTLVAAAALGLEIDPAMPQPPSPAKAAVAGDLLVHRGTLRSGDHLQAEGSVLLLGDVNPGARLSAAGNVLVWGRLRGIAHAGVAGNPDARIVALQLRPLQLRIADVVARGPEGLPPPGLAEQALLVDGEIRIDPAAPDFSG